MHPENHRFGDTKGQTLPLIVVFMLLLMVVCGMVLDIGNAYRVKTGLQASADAAAAAGADQLPNTGNAASAVQQYGSNPAGKNPVRGSGNVTISSVTNYVTSREVLRSGQHGAGHGEHLRPDAFLRVIGIDTIPITVHSQACSPCGGEAAGHHGRARPHRIDAGQKLDDAKAGIKAFLSTMDTGLDNVGLAVLPRPPTPHRVCQARVGRLELRQRQRRLRAGAAVEHLRHHDQRQHHAQSELAAAADDQLCPGQRRDRICNRD